MRIAISACLLGIPARYDGGTKPCPAVISLAEEPGVEVVAVCPETAAGLPVPRPPAEHRNGRVVFADGVDATEAFERGSAACLEEVLAAGVDFAVLKAKSPSCGAGRIHDGTFTGGLVDGWGTFAALVRDAGIPVLSEEDVERAVASARRGESCDESVLALVCRALGLL